MRQKFDPSTLGTPEARRAIDDVRRHDPELAADTIDHVPRYIDSHADDPDPFKLTRRLAHAIVRIGELGPGVVGLGVFAMAGGLFWLRSL
jgi:hypothetical protein